MSEDAEKPPGLKFLVCSDGHAQAERVVRLASNMAASCGAEVTLLGISETEADQKSLHDALQREQDILRSRNVTAGMIARTGDPVAGIARQTEQEKYDIVFVGAEQRAGSGPFQRSAKTYKIIKTVRPSVLVVVGRPPPIRKILLCSGGSRAIRRAVELLARIAAPMQASVTIAHVLPEPPLMYADMMNRLGKSQELIEGNSHLGRTLRGHRDLLREAGIEAEVKLRHGLVGRELLSELHDGDYDLVVTGKALSRGLVESYIMGDVTREIVNRAECPMLVVRSREQGPGWLEALGSRVRGMFGKKRA